MISAEESLNFIREQIDALGHGSKHHERAAHDTLVLLPNHWSEESGESMDNGLAVIEIVGQDLAKPSAPHHRSSACLSEGASRRQARLTAFL